MIHVNVSILTFVNYSCTFASYVRKCDLSMSPEVSSQLLKGILTGKYRGNAANGENLRGTPDTQIKTFFALFAKIPARCPPCFSLLNMNKLYKHYK